MLILLLFKLDEIKPISETNEVLVEEHAIIEVIKTITNLKVNFNTLNWEKSDFMSDLKDFNKGKYFSNNRLCFISLPLSPFSDGVGYSNSNFLRMSSNRDSLRNNMYSPIEFSSQYLEHKTFGEFKKQGCVGEYFFSIRHHLVGIDSYLVQIHVVPYNKIKLPFEYTFYVFFDKEMNLIESKGSNEGAFEYDLDC